MTNIISSFEEFQKLPVGAVVTYAPRRVSRTTYKKIAPALWQADYTTLYSLIDESFEPAADAGHMALVSTPVVELTALVRGYDFGAGDERFGSREEAVDRAVVRSETRGKQQVRPYFPFLDGGEQTWLVQDA